MERAFNHANFTAMIWGDDRKLMPSGSFWKHPATRNLKKLVLPVRTVFSSLENFAMADDNNKQQAIAEKELGNQAYKKRQFEEALAHYEKAWELDNTNISILTNKAGSFALSLSFLEYLVRSAHFFLARHSCPV